MKTTGLSFTDAMVRALLAGTKTQTRRIVPITHRAILAPDGQWICPPGRLLKLPNAPGDVLYAKENFFCDDFRYPNIPIEDQGDETFRNQMLYFRADGADLCQQIPECTCDDGKAPPWKSGRFMPKWIARIWLEVTACRFELLCDISEEDAKAEGVLPSLPVADERWVNSFHLLWDSINGKSHPWSSNPLVVVREFQFLEVIGKQP